MPIALIGADPAGSSGLREQLERAGHRVSEIDPAAFADDAVAPDDASNDTAAVGEIAVLVAEEGDDPTEQAARLIALLPSLAAAAARKRIPLWIVTTGAQQAAPSDFADGGTPMPVGVVGAAVWGFARVLINETPLLSLRLVDFPPTADGTERGRGARPGAGGGNAGNRDRLDPVGPPCAAAAPRAAAALGGCRVRRWRSTPDRRAGIDCAALAAGRSRDRRDRARFRSRCMPPGSISAT